MVRSVCFALVSALALCGASAARAEVYGGSLTGAAEAPPNASPATGSTLVTFDPVAHLLRVQAVFSGLVGTTTVAHIHAATAVAGTGTAGVATQTPTFSGFPTGVTFGFYDQTFDTSLASSWNPAYITANGGTTAGAEAALFAALNEGKAYLNIHTTAFPGGEIRGFLTAVPEPGPLALAAVAGLGVWFTRRKRAV